MNIPGWIYASLNTYDGKYSYQFCPGDLAEPNEYLVEKGYIAVRPHTITFDLPADLDLRSQAIAALRRQQDAIRGEMQAKINAINERIQSLLAIEHRP